MKHRGLWITFILASLLVIAGCADFSKFSKEPVNVHVKVVDPQGNTVASQVMLIGPDAVYGPVASGPDGVATLTSVPPGNYALSASAGELLATRTLPVWGGKDLVLTVQASPINLGRNSIDINTGLAGATIREGDAIRLRAGGHDIWGGADGIRFVYVEVPGDLTIVARVAELHATHGDGWTKAGVMVRDSLDANSKHVATLITSGNGVQMVRREQTGGESFDNNPKGLNVPIWLKLERVGNTFTSSYSTNGVDWVHVASHQVEMTGTVFVGLVLTAHGEENGLAEALFDNIELKL